MKQRRDSNVSPIKEESTRNTIMKSIVKPSTAWLCVLLMTLGLAATQAQTVAVWTNTAGGNWNTAVNWADSLLPDSATLTSAAITNAGTYTVTYSAPMVAVSIPSLQ